MNDLKSFIDHMIKEFGKENVLKMLTAGAPQSVLKRLRAPNQKAVFGRRLWVSRMTKKQMEEKKKRRPPFYIR